MDLARILAAGLTALVLSAAASAQTSQPSAAALLARLEANQNPASGHSVGTLTVEDRYGTKTTEFEAWTLGADRSLTVFTSGEEKGQKILRLKDTLYVAYPEADKPVKIQGAALKDSVAGSDFSYEDLAGDRSLAGRYEPRIVGTEAVAGEPCHILELKAKRPGLAYPLVKVWVSAADGAARRVEQYSLGGRLLKTQEVLETFRSGGRTLVRTARMADALKTGSKTLIRLTVNEPEVRVDPAKFSLEELTW